MNFSFEHTIPGSVRVFKTEMTTFHFCIELLQVMKNGVSNYCHFPSSTACNWRNSKDYIIEFKSYRKMSFLLPSSSADEDTNNNHRPILYDVRVVRWIVVWNGCQVQIPVFGYIHLNSKVWIHLLYLQLWVKWQDKLGILTVIGSKSRRWVTSNSYLYVAQLLR